MLTNMKLWPFFCYFGGKWRAAPHYPKPRFNHIVEPFAGAAGYSLRYCECQVTLYEVDPKIYGIWDYLIRSTSAEIMALPSAVSHVNEISGPQEARWLVGFWLNKATTAPSLTPSAWMRQGLRPNSQWGDAIKSRISNQVEAIRHWKILNKSYEEADGIEATWFVDPPYQAECGRQYSFNKVDFQKLGEWCRTRKGQVIACEQSGATWLPFKDCMSIKSTEGKRGKKKSKEVIWVA